MNSRRRFLIAAVFVVISGVMSVLAAPELPARMATHWNAAGQSDGTISKPVALALLPVLTALLLVMFALAPCIDPLRENIASFRSVYDWFVVVFTAFMTVIHGGVIVFNLGYESISRSWFSRLSRACSTTSGCFLSTQSATGSSVFGHLGRSRVRMSGIEPIVSGVVCSN